MKAMVMTAAGNTDVLKLQDVAEPKIDRPNQILVELKAAGVNPIDTKIRRRGSFLTRGSERLRSNQVQ